MKFKKILVAVLSVALISSALPMDLFDVTVSAATNSGTTGECTWTLNGTVLTISGSGAMANYTPETPPPWGNSITKVIFGYEVTHIGSYAFSGCEELNSVVMPDFMLSIGESAFMGCTSLTSVSMHGDMGASVGDYAFAGCIELQSVYINGEFTSLGDYTFADCINITKVVFNDGGAEVLKGIGDYVFSGCTSLVSISLLNGMYYVGDYTFAGCTSLSSVKGLDKITQIGTSAFEGCTNLSIIELSKIKEIGESAFFDCNSLSDVYYYKKSELDRSNIIIGSLNDSLLNANWIYYYCGHTQESTVYPPSCTTQGYTYFNCSTCKYNYKVDYVDAVGHNFGEWMVEREPTCTELGNKYQVCDRCGLVQYEEVSAYGHAYDSWKYESVPTCTTAGGIVCTCLLCGEQRNISIEPYGHDFSTEWTIDVEPKCTKVGIKSHHCIRCDEVSDETEIQALGHNYTDVIVKPTCTEEGYTEHVCASCGDSYKTDIVNANEHTYIHYEQKNATCSENGYEAYDECSVCGYTTFKEIVSIGHNYQPTDGGYICVNCNSTINSSHAHNYVKTIIKATEEQKGYTQYTCKDCGYYYKTDESEYITGPKITISDAIVGAGKKVILTVSLSDNPGIYSFTLGVDYDKENLTLTEVRNLGTLDGDISSSTTKVLWLNNTRENSFYNGDILQLVFTVSPYSVAQDYSVSLTYNAGNIINYALEDVDFSIEQGIVTVENYTAGDLNGDNVVNNKDLVLMSEIFSRNYTIYYHNKEHNDKNKVKNFNLFGKTAISELKNYEVVSLGVTVSRVALDCNNDGVINNHDLLTMMKYLRGEKITIW